MIGDLRGRWAPAALLAVALAASGCSDLRVINEESRDQRQFEFHADRLVIDNVNSDLRIVTGPAGSVSVERVLTGKATQEGNATWSFTDGTLRLRVECSGLVINCGAFHIVHVPDGISVTAESEGPVRMLGRSGDLTATVRDWLRVEEPAGALDLTAGLNVEVTAARTDTVVATSTGRDVHLSFAEPPDRVEAESVHGSVEIIVPDGPETYRIEASHHHGEVTPELASDPDSERTITANANHDVTIRAGA